MPIDKILNSVNQNPAIKGALGGAAGGALVTAMLGNKTAKKAVKAGGLMALGGLAWHAYQNYQQGTTNEPGETETLREEQFDLSIDQSGDSIGLIIKALIAASHADGQLDDQERDRIWQQAIHAGLSGDQLEALSLEIHNPVGVAELAAHAQNMEDKIEVYTASRLLIDHGCEAGEHHLNALSQALSLPPGLVRALDQEVPQPNAA